MDTRISRNFNLVYSQGNIGDRTLGTIRGAELMAEKLSADYSKRIIKSGLRENLSVNKKNDWLSSLSASETNLKHLREAVEKSIISNDLTVMVSGTCSASLASLPVVAQHFPKAKIIWCDAHGDFNTPDTSNSKYLGGMVLAGVCGLWDSGHGNNVKPEQLIIVGGHDFDSDEYQLLQKFGVEIISPSKMTPESVFNSVKDKDVWIHVDWDVLQPGFIPADYEVDGGVSLSQLQKSVFQAIPTDRVIGVELAEFNADFDESSNDKFLLDILNTISPLLKKNG